MSVSEVAERSAAYELQTVLEPASGASFDLLVTAPQGVTKLRQLILSFAIRGKLVPQDAADGSSSSLLTNVWEERKRLEACGALKRKSSELVGHNEEWAKLPESWAWSCLASVGIINPRNDVSDDTEASFVQMSSVPVALMEAHKTERRPWREIKSGFTHFAEGDVGVAKITPCFENGKSTVFRNLESGVGSGTTELHIVRPLAGISPDYILVFLKSPEFLLPGEKGMTGSAGQKRLSRQYFETRAFPLPPVAEQSRIVARVEELMQLCDSLEAHGRLQDEQHARLVTTLFDALAASDSAHALAENWQRIAAHFDLLLDRTEAVDALEQTILQLAVRGLLVPQISADDPARQLLDRMQKSRVHKRKFVTYSDKAIGSLQWHLPDSWCWASIDQISADDERAITDGPFGANLKTEHYVDRPGYRVIRLQNIGHNDFRDEHRAYIEEARFNSLIKHQICAGDLAVAGLIDSSIRCCVVPDNVGSAIVKADCYRLAVHLLVSGTYIAHYLNSVTAREFASVHHHGLTLKRIGLGNFRTIPVPLPPLAEQHRIVARVEELRRLCNDLRERLQQARATQSQLADALVSAAAQSPAC